MTELLLSFGLLQLKIISNTKSITHPLSPFFSVCAEDFKVPVTLMFIISLVIRIKSRGFQQPVKNYTPIELAKMGANAVKKTANSGKKKTKSS